MRLPKVNWKLVLTWAALLGGLTSAQINGQINGGSSGVSQIVAGTNVTLSPVGGTGVVTVNASGGSGTGANPTGSVGPTAVNGVATTFLRSDGAPPLNETASYTLTTGTWTFNGTVAGTGLSTYLASPPAIGGTAAGTGAFTTLSASSTVSGTGFSSYLASPPAIGGTAAAAGTFTSLSANAGLTATNAANSYSLTSTGLSSTSGTTGFGRNITGTVNNASVVDGIIDFANITCTSCIAGDQLVDWQVGGSSKFKVDYTGLAVFASSVQATYLIMGATQNLSWGARGILSSNAAGDVQIGNTNAASPINQTLSTQGSIGGTSSNVAGANLIIQSGLGTGNSTGSTLSLQTPHATTTGTTQQTANNQIVMGDNTVSMPNIASSSAATTGTVCWTTGGNLTVDTTLACLSSTGRIKENVHDLDDGLATVMSLRPVSYDLKPEFNPKGLGPQVGLIAEEVQKVDPRLVGLDTQGAPLGVRYMQLTAELVSAIQHQQREIDSLKKQLRRHH
jgi:hypothetical protein